MKWFQEKSVLHRWFFILPFFLIQNVKALPKFDINDFIADTLQLHLAIDSIVIQEQSPIIVCDDRTLAGPVLGIQQIKKYRYIPVDQYIVMQDDLSKVFNKYLVRDSVQFSGRLYIKNLEHWYDGSPALAKGRKLNAYTVLEDSNGQIVSDWIWEYSLKPKKKQKSDIVLGELMDKWLSGQTKAIRESNFNCAVYPYLYRRQLMNWWDLVILEDGYILNTHLTLDYPADQMKSWIRGSPGIFYRKARYHQSIAIGGKDQQWYSRINDNLLRRLNICYRFGFNNFEKDRYEHLDFWNIFLVNISANASVEYRPVYLKGFYIGAGAHLSLNILPEIIEQVEPGFMVTAGFILP